MEGFQANWEEELWAGSWVLLREGILLANQDIRRGKAMPHMPKCQATQLAITCPLQGFSGRGEARYCASLMACLALHLQDYLLTIGPLKISNGMVRKDTRQGAGQDSKANKKCGRKTVV